ncbi:MAG: hypothetical protein BWX45_00708 [Deltaproteobacteria bacterium ADurb.Bin002]|nr:MAG: hypothetical protein BWX45_00708 [Deltaproteobacteria bacterium ADurb.Bin002]
MGHIELRKPRILEVRGAPGLAAVVASIHRVVVGRMKARGGVQRIDGPRARIRRKQIVVLGDRAIGPLVGLGRLRIESTPHCRRPGVSTIARSVDSSLQGPVHLPAPDRAIEDRHAGNRIGTAGKGLDVFPGQALRAFLPAPPCVLGSPDALGRRRKDGVPMSRAIEVEADHPPDRAGANLPIDAPVP